MIHPRSLAFCLLALSSACIAAAADPVTLTGSVTFTPAASEPQVPERFRLAAATFDWQAVSVPIDSQSVEVWDVTYPSPVVTPHVNNNTVHAEFYRSKRDGRRPAVIVLHILGGDFPLSRLFCNRLAQQGVSALFVKMPFYGPRRDQGSKQRMVSVNPDETVAGMTQAVLDIRRSVAWLAARDDVDPERIGIFGISLGGITGGLAAGIDPQIHDVCLLLAGGDIGRVAFDSAELKKVRGELPRKFNDPETFIKTLSVIDPVTYASRAKGKHILMLNATHDEVIPKDCTLSLWKGFGEPEIKWYSGGHYSVVFHLPRALERVAHFFAAEPRTSETTAAGR